MSKKIYFTGAKVVLSHEVLEDASILVEDGYISAINPTSVSNAETINISGKTLIPGMIDLHCDALEKEIEPRPNVYFPVDFAIAQADKRNALAGITTVYHALSFANEELGVRNNTFAAEIARNVHAWQPHALVDNRVHCRYEVTDESGLPVLLDLLENNDMHLLSFMDHTPGQGQFKDMVSYRNYLNSTYKTSDKKLDDIIARKQSAAEGALERIKTLVSAARRQNISVASHDDDNTERVETMHSLGVKISEFPINLQTAEYAKEMGVSTIFGAPNILRGKSQSGSMRALDAINAGVADCLCADYSPAALIVAVFKLAQNNHLDLPTAIRMVTVNPAKAAALDDRGEIAVGKKADLAVVTHFGELPQVSSVWVHGKQAYQANYDHG